jgi:hypothetical protein
MSITDYRKDVRTIAWQTIRDRVRLWPRLKTMNPLYMLPEDSGFDDPAPESRLTIKMAPKFGPMVAIASNGIRRVYEAPVVVTFEVTAPGLKAEVSHAAWHEIEMAVSGADLDNANLSDFRQSMIDIGLNDAIFLQPADSLAGGTTGEGSIQGYCFVTR